MAGQNRVTLVDPGSNEDVSSIWDVNQNHDLYRVRC